LFSEFTSPGGSVVIDLYLNTDSIASQYATVAVYAYTVIPARSARIRIRQPRERLSGKHSSINGALRAQWNISSWLRLMVWDKSTFTELGETMGVMTLRQPSFFRIQIQLRFPSKIASGTC